MSTLSTSRRRSELLRLDLLSNHAIFGCDSVSVLFGKGKKTMLHKVKSLRNISYIEAFINTDNKKEDSGSWRKVLDHVVLGAQFYGRAIRKSKLSSEFRLQTLPPPPPDYFGCPAAFLPHIPHSHCSNGVETTCLLLTGAGHSLQEIGQIRPVASGSPPPQP